jgi:hypothetical protein
MKKLIFILLLVTISLYAHHPKHEEEHEQKEEICFDQKDLHFHSSINEKPTVGKHEKTHFYFIISNHISLCPSP